jgi:hypothetical protein
MMKVMRYLKKTNSLIFRKGDRGIIESVELKGISLKLYV